MNNFTSWVLPTPIHCGAPFMPPWKRPLSATSKHRLMTWCDELIPGVTVEIDHWVGADSRQPLHAVGVSFPKDVKPPIVVYRKVENMRKCDLFEAFGMRKAS